jgi:predicted restriction endonuclease
MSIGRKFSPEHLVNISGENASNWQGGISTENEIMRKRKEYRLWREAVFSRDNWECQECHDRSREGHPVILNADHIKPFALFPELRFAIDNGITLCESCHRKTPTFGCKIRNYNMQAV